VNPWAGFGVGGLATPYDSLWLQVLVLSGIMGLVLMCAALATLGWRWLRLRAVTAPAERSLAGSVLILTVITSFGFPTLTANRGGILAWLILGVMITGRDYGPTGRLQGTRSLSLPLGRRPRRVSHQSPG
jgi:O-antigen ligase